MNEVLDNNDLQSVCWGKIVKHFEARLIELRARNDGELDAIKTASLRGEIRATKNLLALSLRDQAVEEDED